MDKRISGRIRPSSPRRNAMTPKMNIVHPEASLIFSVEVMFSPWGKIIHIPGALVSTKLFGESILHHHL
jgi:hypothetical protein